MVSFLLISLVIFSSQVRGLKLLDLLPNGNDSNTNSDNSDPLNIQNVVGLIIDQFKDIKALDPTAVPTNTPTLYPVLNKQQSPGLNNQPTFSPTPIPTKIPTLPTAPKRTETPTIEKYGCSLEEKEYQLKMYWKKGMEWQDEKKERAWCAECDDDCDSGEDVRVRECDKDDKDQLWLFYDCTVRPKKNPKVCFTAGATRKDLTGKIELRECDDDMYGDVQKFRFFDPDDRNDKFQFKLLKPGFGDNCLSQEHHPRDKEELRFYSCRTALENDPGVNDDTSHWVVGTFNGHR